MRKRLWQLHSWLGLFAGLGLLVLGLSGSLLVFHEELEALVHPEYVRVEAPEGATRLPLDRLLRDAESQLSGYEVAGWIPAYDEPDHADVLYVIGHGTNEWLVSTQNPYTGEVLATPRKGTQTITGWLLELHYAFFGDHIGMLAVGLFGLLLCLLGVSGIWLYREFWKGVFTLRWGRSARIFFSDLHKTVGISSVTFNILLGFTGAYWNVTHVAGHLIYGDPEQKLMTGRLYPESLSLAALSATASEHIPGFRANYISLPWEPGQGITLWGAVEPRGALRGPYGSTVGFDATGAYQSHDDLRAAGAWRQIVDAFVPLHYGTFGGFPIKLLWCIGGLTPGILAVSGFLIWRSRRKNRPTSTDTASKPVRLVQRQPAEAVTADSR